MSGTKPLPKFRIVDIELISFMMNCAQHLKGEEELQNQFGVGLTCKWILSRNCIQATSIFKIFSDEDMDNSWCELSSQIDFKFDDDLKDIAETLNKKEKFTIIPRQLHATIIAIALSTNRGLLFAKLLGTRFEKAYFPIFDPTVFISEDRKLECV